MRSVTLPAPARLISQFVNVMITEVVDTSLRARRGGLIARIGSRWSSDPTSKTSHSRCGKAATSERRACGQRPVTPSIGILEKTTDPVVLVNDNATITFAAVHLIA